MNIHFMTAEANGIPTGETNWKGEPMYEYYPNFDLMYQKATCDGEREAIRETSEFAKTIGGFKFEIVFTAKALHINPYTCEGCYKWQVLQFPWYDGASKEEMTAIIAEEVKRLEEEEARYNRRAKTETA